MNNTKTSRPANPCQFGKCTNDVKSKVPDIIKEDLVALAGNESVFVRDLITKHCYGVVGAHRGVRIDETTIAQYQTQMKDLIAGLAALEGKTPEDYVNEIVFRHVFGHVVSMPVSNGNGRPGIGTH